MRVLPKIRYPEGRELAAAKIMRSLVRRKDHGEGARSKTHQAGGWNHFEINFIGASARRIESQALQTPPTRLPASEFGNDTERGQRQGYQERRQQQSAGLKSVASVPQGMPEDRRRQRRRDAEGDAPARARGVQLNARGQNEKRRNPERFPPGPVRLASIQEGQPRHQWQRQIEEGARVGAIAERREGVRRLAFALFPNPG